MSARGSVGVGEAVRRCVQTHTDALKLRRAHSRASAPASFPASHQTVNNSCQGFQGTQPLHFRPCWWQISFICTPPYNKTRLGLDCRLISAGDSREVLGGGCKREKVCQGLNELWIPELLSEVARPRFVILYIVVLLHLALLCGGCFSLGIKAQRRFECTQIHSFVAICCCNQVLCNIIRPAVKSLHIKDPVCQNERSQVE